MSAWKKLAEALGIETEANWDRLRQQRNMQRYGTQDRRTQMGPTAYFNTRGTGLAQRQGTAAMMQPDMTPRPGGISAPAPQDRPGQGNPLYDPPRARPKSPLSTAPNSPQALSPDEDEQDY